MALSGDGTTAPDRRALKAVGGKTDVGEAYFYTRAGSAWTQQRVLTATASAAFSLFGISVALSGDGTTALVGAQGAAGAAYMYTPAGTTWTQQIELTATNTVAGDGFGAAVALSGDGTTALVGADNKTVGGNRFAGAAFAYTQPGAAASVTATASATASAMPVALSGIQPQTLRAKNSAANDQFGIRVALSGDGNTALVGATGKAVGGKAGAGAAYVFTRRAPGDGWNLQQVLTASDGAAQDGFGFSVALSGDGTSAVVGAWEKTIGGHTHAGAAYVFTRSGRTWTQQQELTAADAADSDGFGSAVALSSDGSTILVGAFGRTVGGKAEAGAAYVYTRSGGRWTQRFTLTAANGAAGDSFGARWR